MMMVLAARTVLVVVMTAQAMQIALVGLIHPLHEIVCVRGRIYDDDSVCQRAYL